MVKVELTKQEIDLIVYGMTGTVYPIEMQKIAFELVMKLRAATNGAT